MSIEDIAKNFSAIVAASVAVGTVLYYLVRWRPIEKEWCFIFYGVSNEAPLKFVFPQEIDVPSSRLDEKLDQVIEVIGNLPSGSALTFVQTKLLGISHAPQGIDWDDVHIVYRALWGSRNAKVSDASIVTWRPGAEKPLSPSFASSSQALSDKDGFMEWVYKNCPAKRYAVLFWGHSIGPGGLFHPKSSAKFPPPPAVNPLAVTLTSAEAADMLRVLQDLRDGRRKPEELRTGAYTPPSGSGSAAQSAGAGGTPPHSRRAAVVIFQSCWMATLETVYEFSNVARYVVGSQEQVPIGYLHKDKDLIVKGSPLWPYEKIVGDLVHGGDLCCDHIADTLKEFFAESPQNRWPLDTVQCSVLDLGVAASDLVPLRNEWSALVAALMHAGVTKNDRYDLISDCANDEWALTDVVKWCRRLVEHGDLMPTLPPGVKSQLQTAAQNLLETLRPDPTQPGKFSLCRAKSFEVGLKRAAHGGGSVSVLWIPSKVFPFDDQFISQQVDPTFYGNLQLVQENQGWKTVAFEQQQ